MKEKMFALAPGALLFALCLCAEAQQSRKIARLGYLSTGDPVSRHDRVEALRQGLKELGYIEGKNINIEYRYAGGRSDRLPTLAQELVRLNVDIIFAGGAPATAAAKKATLTIPIVTAVTIRLAVGLSPAWRDRVATLRE